MDDSGHEPGSGQGAEHAGPPTLSAYTYHRVEHQLELAEAIMREIDAATARAIAAALHQRDGSPLHIFALYGRLHPGRALRELEEGTFDLLQVRWAAALITFLEAADPYGNHPHLVEAEPPPRVYVTRSGGLHGRWIDLSLSEHRVEDALAGIAPLARTTDTATGWNIHAHMGFSELFIPEDEDLWLLHHIACGISRHGEAYAIYATHDLHLPLSEEDFERHYYGCTASTEAFVLDRAEENGWLKAISDLNTKHHLHGLLTLDIHQAADRLLSEDWSLIQGTNGMHIFGPAKPPA